MTSARPKLRPETPKALTGWDTLTGRPVWLSGPGTWSADIRCLQVLRGPEADEALAAAFGQQQTVTDPYLMEVTGEGCIAGRETLRERLRAGLTGICEPADLAGRNGP